MEVFIYNSVTIVTKVIHIPRIREREIIVRPPRNERIIIYVNEVNKRRFQRLYVDMGVKNYEEALTQLLDIYELCCKNLRTTKLEDIKSKLSELFGLGVRLKIID